MIIQSSGNLRKLSLYDLFNDLKAQESTVLSNSVKSGGPLALLSNSAGQVGATSEHVSYQSRAKTQMVSEDNSLSYEDSEEDEDEEEAFQ